MEEGEQGGRGETRGGLLYTEVLRREHQGGLCAGKGGSYLRRGLSMGYYGSYIDLLLTHKRA